MSFVLYPTDNRKAFLTEGSSDAGAIFVRNLTIVFKQFKEPQVNSLGNVALTKPMVPKLGRRRFLVPREHSPSEGIDR